MTAGEIAPEVRTSLRGHTDFHRLWAGDVVGQLGSQVTLFLLPLIALGALGATATQVGLLQALYTVPFVALPLLAGAWLERRARRPVMITMDLVRCVLVASIPLAAVLGVLTLPQLLVAAFVGGALTVVYDIAAASYLPRLVSGPQLDGANSRLSADQAVGATAGPGIAGWLAGLVGASGALVLDAVSYLVSAFALWRIRHREEPVVDPAPRDLRREIADGVRAVLRVPAVRGLALHASIYNMGIEIVTVAFLVHFVRDLDLGTAAFGVVMVLGGIGGITGALTAPLLIARVGYGPALLCALTVSTTVYVVLPWASGSPFVVTALCAATFFVGCAGAAGGGVVAVTVRQRLTAPQLLARMSATYRMVSYGSIPIGALVGGFAVDAHGARAVLWCAPAVLLASVVPVLGRSVRGLRRLE